MRALALLFLALPAYPCEVTIEPACAPYCEDRGAICPASCTLDSTVWLRASYVGECGGPPEWSIWPGPPEGFIGGWHNEPGAVECGDGYCAMRAYARGPAGKYVVRATAPGGEFGELVVELPEGAP
jgi:hypothetical protein